MEAGDWWRPYTEGGETVMIVHVDLARGCCQREGGVGPG